MEKNRDFNLFFLVLFSPICCVLCVMFMPTARCRFELKMKRGWSADFRQEFCRQVCSCTLFKIVDLTESRPLGWGVTTVACVVGELTGV